MELAIYTPDDIKVDVLQNTTSVQWQSYYNKTGYFEIHAKGTPANQKYLVVKNRLVRSDTNEIGFITYVFPRISEITGDEEIEVRGYLNNLDNRTNPTVSKIKNVEADLYALVNKNKRNLNITTAPLSGIMEKIDNGMETTGKNLDTTFTDVCEQLGLGFRMVRKNRTMNVIELYKRSIKDKVKFSDELGNIVAQSYLINISDYKNFAYVYGQGKNEERIGYTVDLTSGGDRYELYVDARDIGWTYYDDNNVEHQHTAESYKQALIQRGIEKLLERRAIREFTAEVNSGDSLFRFGEDYELGDIVKTNSKRYALAKYFRIQGVRMIEELGTETIKLTLTDYEEEANALLEEVNNQ